MTRTLLIVILALIAIAVPAILDRSQPDQLGHGRVETTTDTTPSTTWLETQPDLGHRFDEYRAGVARAQAVRVKRKPVLISVDGSVWDRLAECESHGNWAINTGNGYFGGLQMDMDFWHAWGGPEFAARPDLASREQQIIVAERARAVRGFQPWPHCSKVLGLR